MQLLLLTCAETCVIDVNTNRPSLFNLIEEISSPTFPAAIFTVAIFTLWERDEAEPDSAAELVIRLNNNQLFQAPVSLAFQGTRRCRAVLSIQGLVITEPGSLTFEVRHSDNLVGAWRVPVLGAAQAMPVSAPPPAASP
jgi:hypothetical protein